VRVRRFLLGLGAIVFFGAIPTTLQYPPAPSDNTADTYYGTKVSDPYRPLENAKDPAVRAWAAAETKLASDFIREQPSYGFYTKRLAEVNATAYVGSAAVTMAGGRFFYLWWNRGDQQGKLVVRDRIDGPERVLFDPKSAEQRGIEPSIAEYWVSADGSKVAVATQYGGDEECSLRVIDVKTAVQSDDIAHIGNAGLSGVAVAWDRGDKGFIHTVEPKKAGGTYGQWGIQLVHHVLGTNPATDTYVFGRGMSQLAEYVLLASPYRDAVAILETDGDGVAASVYLRWNEGTFHKVAGPEDKIVSEYSLGVQAAFVADDLDVISKKHSSFGDVLAIAPGRTIASARTIVPAGRMVIDGIVAVPNGLVTWDIDGGDSASRLFSPHGALRAHLPIPPISFAQVLADPVRGPIMLSYQSYTMPTKRLIYNPATNMTRPSPIIGSPDAPAFPGVILDRVMVPSLDGKARIPLEIVHAKSVPKNGTAPTIVNAYGAYGAITQPYYDQTIIPWLERGGVYAHAMIRGGGEYGDAWQAAAKLATKTVSSDDLAACVDWLAAHGYGNAKHVGIWGASAGGFLMGLALTRDPQRYRAVVSEVGIYDLLRVELTLNGENNTPEFGTVKDPIQFAWMLKQSPYHNVVDGTAYPAVLMMTGENDARVDPYNSRKMIARLQAATSSGYPVLLIQRSGEGHGVGNSVDQVTDENAAAYTFFDSQLR